MRNATITSLSLPSLDSAGPSTAAMTLEGKMPYNDFTVPLGSDSAGQRRVVSRSTSSSSSEDLEKLRRDRFEWCSEYSQQMYVHLETLQATYQPSRAYIDTTDLYAPHIMRRGGDAVMETPVLKGRGVGMSEDNDELESIRVNSAIRSLLIEFMIRMHDQNMIHHQDVLPMAISLLDRYLAKEYRRISTSNTKPAPPYAQFPMPAEYGLPSVPWMPATKHLMQAAMAAFMLAIKYESRRVGFFLTPMCVVWRSAVVSVTSTKNSASKGKQRQDAASSTGLSVQQSAHVTPASMASGIAFDMNGSSSSSSSSSGRNADSESTHETTFNVRTVSKSGTTSRTLKCTGSQGIKMSNLGALAMIDDITLTSLDDYSSDGKAKHSDHDRDPFPREHKKLVQMQHGMLRILDYALRVPTYTAFLKRYASFANLSSAQQTLCTLLLERVNLEYISLDYFPSLLAASAVYLIKCLGLYTMSSVHESSRKARSTTGGLTLKSKDMKQFQRNGTNAHLTNSTVESQERDIGKDGDLPYPGGQAAYYTLTAKDIWTSNLSRDTGYSVQMVDECAREMVRVLKDEEAVRWKQHRDAQSRQQVGIHVTGSGSHDVNKAGKGRKVTPEKGFDGSMCRMYIPGDSLIHKYSNLKYSKLLRLPPVLSLSSDQESSDDSSDVSQKLQDLMTSTLTSLMVRDVHYVRRRRARSDTPEILPDHLVDKTKGGRVIETWK